MTDAQLTPQRIAEIATAFAKAIDHDDFAAAGRLLSEVCTYDTGAERLTGRDAILDSYVQASRWARSTFDDVRYDSEMLRADARGATVRFTGYLVKAGGAFHRHRCEQDLSIDDRGEIDRIVHRELPGEREALQAFLARCGSIAEAERSRGFRPGRAHSRA